MDRSTASETPILTVNKVGKRFRRTGGTVFSALDDISFDLARGEFLVLLGPSGCGKTTLLRAMAGLETPDEGEIVIDGRVCFSGPKEINLPVEQRHISMVFQSYALWPHMTVFDNVSYPLRSRRVRQSKAQIADAVGHVLELVNIPELAAQYPGQMSGGQQQRVALARALVAGSELILFDEPLSNVDAKVREQLREELIAMQSKLGFSAVYVTHDQHEAMGLGHRIAVMNKGKVEQIDTPRRVYEAAETRYVANFLGRVNELEGMIVSMEAGVAEVDTALGRCRGILVDSELAAGDKVVVLWRPEDSLISAEQAEQRNCFRGRLESELFLGSYIESNIRCGDTKLVVWRHPYEKLDVGLDVMVGVDPDRVRVLRG